MEKLVRDEIPHLMFKDGVQFSIRQVSGEELDLFLRKKLVEEANEFLEAGTNEELADVITVLTHIRQRQSSANQLDVDDQIVHKMNRKGGFYKGYVIDFPEKLHRTPYCEERNSHPGKSCNVACC